MLIVGTSASSIVFYGFAHWVPTLLEAQGVTVTKSLLYSSPPIWILLGVLLTLASEMNSTAVHTYRAELFPTHIRAKAIGFIYSFSRLSSALSNFIIGFMLLKTGVQGVFVFLALVMAVSIIVITVWGPRPL